MIEVWKAVVGFEGQYDVSNLGRVRSLPRAVQQVRKNGKTHTIHLKGRILKMRPEYPQVGLPCGMRYVSQLMSEAFSPATPDRA